MDIRFTLTEVNVAGLDAARERAADLSPAMLSIASYLQDTAFERINDTNIGPDGRPWKPSQRILAGIGPGKTTLNRSGHLMSSLASRADASSAVVGTPSPYARIHQFGGTIRPRAGSGKRALKTPDGPRASVTMPARPFIGFSDGNREQVMGILADHLAGAAA